MRGRVADDGGSASVDELAVGVAAAVVVAELVTDDVVVAPELADELELLELDGVEGAELAGGDEVVEGGGCELVVVGELGCVDPESGSTYC